MKKFILILFALFSLSLSINAQVVDFGFEMPWTGISGNPQGWASAKIAVPNVVLRDTTVFHSINTSAKITTSDVSSIASFTNGLLPGTSGIMLTGFIGFSSPPVKLGYPFTQRQDSLAFYARYLPQGTDTGFAQVILYKRQGAPTYKRDTLAMGLAKITSSSLFNLNYVILDNNPNFPTSILPDSALIVFSSSMVAGGQLGSTLWVDDIQWGTSTTGLNTVKHDDWGMAIPNPANDFINFNFKESNHISHVEIFSLSGKRIHSFKVNSNFIRYNTQPLAPGLYFYRFVDYNGGPLFNGKFIVQH